MSRAPAATARAASLATMRPMLDRLFRDYAAPLDRDRAEQAGLLRRIRPPGECAYCDANRHEPMMPSHTASARCESGKHAHCTCDVCF